MDETVKPRSIESLATLEALLQPEEFRSPSKDIRKKRLTAATPPPKFDTVPSYIYFYHIGFDPSGQLGVIQTLYYETNDVSDEPSQRKPIEHGNVPDKISWMLGGGGAGPNPPPKQSSFGSNFKNDDGHWNRVSYVAFLIDHPNWSFCDSAALPPAVFEEKRTGGGNHTYFDGCVVSINTKNGPRSLFYCVNHYRKKNQDRPQNSNDCEHFKYDLYTQFDFGGTADPVVLIFDPGGTNLGPPEPPY